VEWIKFSKYNLPPQGLKILCFRKGDLWVCRRIHYKSKDYWVEIPYGGKDGGLLTDPPLYWCSIDLPEGFTGLIRVSVDDSPLMTLDELQSTHPKAHEEWANMMISQCRKPNENP
jgi:hypothetical protein